MKKELLRNGLAAIALGAAAAIGVRSTESEIVNSADFQPQIATNIIIPTDQLIKESNELDDFQKVGITFLISSEILGVTLLGYRFSDGAKNRAEKYGWLLGVPSTNLVGAIILLSEMWR
jgi:hypothetical protein